MTTLPAIFSRVDASSLLWFFDEAGICVHAKRSGVKVIFLSNDDVWEIKIKNAYHAIYCPKHQKIFLLGNVNDNAAISVLSIENRTCQKLKAHLFSGTKQSFYSENMDRLIFIDDRGKVVRIDIDSLKAETIMELKDHITLECVNRHGFFHLSSPWRDLGNGIFENYYNIEGYCRYDEPDNEIESVRFELDIENRKVDVNHLVKKKKMLSSRPNRICDVPVYHNNELGIEIYYATEQIRGNEYKTTCEIHKHGKYLHCFASAAECALDITFPRIEFYKDEMFFISLDNQRVYLFNAKTLALKSIDVQDSFIFNMFYYRERELLILTYIDRATKECYSIEDFNDCHEKEDGRMY